MRFRCLLSLAALLAGALAVPAAEPAGVSATDLPETARKRLVLASGRKANLPPASGEGEWKTRGAARPPES